MKAQGSSQSRKRYDAAFKREAVRLADTSGETDWQVERDLECQQERPNPLCSLTRSIQTGSPSPNRLTLVHLCITNRRSRKAYPRPPAVRCTLPVFTDQVRPLITQV